MAVPGTGGRRSAGGGGHQEAGQAEPQASGQVICGPCPKLRRAQSTAAATAFSASPSGDPESFPRRPGRVEAESVQLADGGARNCPARARRRRSQPRTVPAGTPSAACNGPVARPAIARPAGGAHYLDAVRTARRAPGRQQDTGPAAGPAARPPRPQPRDPPAAQPGPPVPGRTPTGPAGLPGMTGTRSVPAARSAATAPASRHSSTAGRSPGRLGHQPSLPGTGRPGQGAFVLQHAPPPPGQKPESPTSPQNRHHDHAAPGRARPLPAATRARHAHGQPRADAVHEHAPPPDPVDTVSR